MTSRISAISIDSLDPQPVADFWCSVLGWQVREADEEGVSIGPADGSLPTLDFLVVPEKKAGKNRIHIDLRADGSTQDVELARLLGLGARHENVGQGADVSWVVLADPEGNEFCLLLRTVQEVESGS